MFSILFSYLVYSTVVSCDFVRNSTKLRCHAVKSQQRYTFVYVYVKKSYTL